MTAVASDPPRLQALGVEPERLQHVRACLDEIRRGKIVILVDDEDRENEGDLVFAAELVTPEAVNFMAKFGRGLICLTLTEEQVERLQLPMMSLPRWRGEPPLGTAFTLSIEARCGVTTGISAADRAHTIQVAIADGAGPDDVVTPGHVFPLKARKGGVLVRSGQTEGSVDLARLAGLKPAGVICEIMNDDGTMARMPDLELFAQEHGLKILSVADLIAYRLQTEQLVEQKVERALRLDSGKTWRLVVFHVGIEGREFLALCYGTLVNNVLCRMHRGSLIADLFCATDSEGGRNLQAALRRIEAEGAGLVVYIPSNQSLASELERLSEDVSETARSGGTGEERAPQQGALREFGLGAQVLRALGLTRVRLLTNNPRKIVAIGGYGLEILESLPLGTKAG